jgi:hypothetical protein
MTKISTTSTNNDDPSILLAMSWHKDWNPKLTALTAWNHATDSCTTTSTEAVTTGVVTADLDAWKKADPNHRDWSVN